MTHVAVDHCVSLDEMGTLLVRLVGQPAMSGASAPKQIKTEIQFAKMEKDMDDMGELGKPTTFTCPSCNGTLWELQRALEKKGAALRRITELYTEKFPALKDQYEVRAREADETAEKIRQLLGRTEGIISSSRVAAAMCNDHAIAYSKLRQSTHTGIGASARTVSRN